VEQSDSPKFNPVNFYLGFSGRINRKQFWLYGYIPLLVVLLAVPFVAAVAVLIRVILSASVFWVSLALQIKRWHDRDKPAWWIFIGLIPIAGPVWALIELGFLRGTPSENRYGPVP